jgi:protein involved in polysaccharide export with SLBB domain
MKVFARYGRLAVMFAMLWSLGVPAPVAGQQKSTPAGTNAPAGGQETAGSTDRLHTGDKILVILADIPMGPMTSEQTITEDGYITLHYNVRVKAAGQTKGDLQEEIRSQYVDKLKYYLRMTVTVKTEERFFYVGGQVKLQGRLPYSGEITVLKAITAAGGFTDFAKKSNVQVTRVNGKTEIVDCEKALKDPKRDLPIYPGDQIEVKRRLW